MKLSGDTTVRYFTKRDDAVAGPYTVEGLESLVYLGKITADTLVSQEGEDAFAPIRSQPTLAKVLFPLFVEKTEPKNWAPPGKGPTAEQPHRKHYRFTEPKFEKLNQAKDPRGAIEVTALLSEIRAAERAAGRDELKPRRFRISHRTRDFWLMLTLGNALFLGGGLLLENTVSMVFAIGGCGLFTWGLLWSMYGVMGKY